MRRLARSSSVSYICNCSVACLPGASGGVCGEDFSARLAPNRKRRPVSSKEWDGRLARELGVGLRFLSSVPNPKIHTDKFIHTALLPRTCNAKLLDLPIELGDWETPRPESGQNGGGGHQTTGAARVLLGCELAYRLPCRASVRHWGAVALGLCFWGPHSCLGEYGSVLRSLKSQARAGRLLYPCLGQGLNRA